MATSSALKPNPSAAPEIGNEHANVISDGIRERRKAGSDAKQDTLSDPIEEATVRDDNEKIPKAAAANSEKVLGRTPDGTGK